MDVNEFALHVLEHAGKYVQRYVDGAETLLKVNGTETMIPLEVFRQIFLIFYLRGVQFAAHSPLLHDDEGLQAVDAAVEVATMDAKFGQESRVFGEDVE